MTSMTRYTFVKADADKARDEGAIVRAAEGTGDDGSDLMAWSITWPAPVRVPGRDHR